MSISTEEQVAIFVHAGFPGSELITEAIDKSKSFTIIFDGQVLLKLDRVGVEFFIPVRGKSTTSWRSFMEGGPDDVANSFLRDLADAGFCTLRADGTKMPKRPVPIGQRNFCPQCDQQGGMKEIGYGAVDPEKFDYDRFIAGGIRRAVDVPNVKCTLCEWSGQKESLRFFKRKRPPEAT